MPFSEDHLDILVVEDNDDDFEATERALCRSGSGRSHNTVLRCRDGLEAWQYLKGEGKAGPLISAQLPGLILLDLNMPGLDGRKFLNRVKNDHALRPIPVVIMTTSNDSMDVQRCYDAGANTYVCKPIRWAEFSAVVGRLRDYWFDLAVLPQLERSA